MLSFAHTHIAGVFSGRSRRSQLVFALHLKWFIDLLQPVTFAIDSLEHVALARYALAEIPQERLRLDDRRAEMLAEDPRVNDPTGFEQFENDLMSRAEFHFTASTIALTRSRLGCVMW
jgi:hypothetical protein